MNEQQIIEAALKDGNMPLAQATAYRLLLRCAERLSAMENLEKEEASGGRSAATPSPDQPSLDPRVEEISRGHDGVWRAYGRDVDDRLEMLGKSANLADLVGVNDKAYIMLGELQIENSKLRGHAEALERQVAEMYEADQRLEAQIEQHASAFMVCQFHQKFGVPIAAIPKFQERKRMDLRVRLIAEEFCEFLAACEYDYTLDITRFAGEKAPGIEETEDVFFKTGKSLDFLNMVAAADGLADLQYVIEGTALEFGIPLAAVFAEVHRSNMTKTGRADDGGAKPSGKSMKGPGYEPPQIERILREHGWEG